MKRKNDDLLRLAFGELSAESARAVEVQASVDEKARAELEGYRALRAGLQRLPAPPPDTLSPDRLRAAILDRELRARRPTTSGWAWAPVALATLAAVVFVSRPRPTAADPQIVATIDEGRLDASPLPTFNRAFDRPSEASVASKPVPEASRKPVHTRSDAFVTLPRKQVEEPLPEGPLLWASDTRRRDDLEESRGPSLPPPSLARYEPQTIAPPTSVIDRREGRDGGMRLASNTDDTVVIVSTKRDLETGAPAATEMEASSVLVGG